MTRIPPSPEFQKDKIPLKVIALISDLFFITRVEATARQVGVPILIFTTPEQLLSQANADPPDLVIIDLNFDSSRSPALIRELKGAFESRPVQIVAYLSHVQTVLAEEARKSGADRVIPRSAFSENLPELLQRRSVGSP